MRETLAAAAERERERRWGAAPEWRARIVAAVNVLNAAFMVGGALVVALLQAAGIGVPILFLGIAGVGLLAAADTIQAMLESTGTPGLPSR